MSGYRGPAAGGGATGAAGGVLSGTYPDPGFAVDMATQAEQDAAIAGLATVYQPLDSDLSAIAALSTTAYGRALLAVANVTGLLAAAGLADVAASGAYSDLTGTPSLATVATSGDYDDLTGLPTLGSASAEDSSAFDAAGAAAAAQAASQPLDSDLTAIAALSTTAFGRTLLTVANTTALLSAAGLADVAASGAYSDLTGTPTLGTAAALDSGTGSGDVPTIADADARYAPLVVPIVALTPTTGAVSINAAVGTAAGAILTHALTGNPTYSVTNKAAGKNFTLWISPGGSDRTPTWPSWKPLGADLPTTLTAGVLYVVDVQYVDGTDANAAAAWQAQAS